MGENSKVPYVSLIKIDGKPILPPIITPELRRELIRHKQQAIKLEKRLKNCRELKRHLDDLLLEGQSTDTRPPSQLTFGDNSHIDALNISSNPTVPRKLKNIHLSRDLIEVTQYDTTGLTTICSNGEIVMEDTSKNEPAACDSEETKLEGSNNDNVLSAEADHLRCRSASDLEKQTEKSDLLEKPASPPKPRLIRSNSYTLESPSPLLLAHLKNTSSKEFNDIMNFNNLASARNWTSLENHHTPLESSGDFSSINTVFYREANDVSEAPSSPDKSAKEIDEIKSPTIEVYQTDISVQQITVNTNNTLGQNGAPKEDKREAFFTKNAFDVFEPDSELLSVLKDIPDTYANQIIELLKKQHLEQKERLERYDNMNEKAEKFCLNSKVFCTHTGDDWADNQENLKESIPSKQNMFHQDLPKSPTKLANDDNLIDLSTSLNIEHDLAKQSDDVSRPNTAESCNNPNKPLSEKLRRSSTFSMSPSQSLYYSVTSDCDTLTNRLTPSINLQELENNNAAQKTPNNIEIGVLRQKNGYWEGVLKHENGARFSCSKELFPEIDPVTIKAMKQEWAASVIGAHVRGYLTRRLIQTEKVQSLIATVKDVLMCALELHHSDNIDEKDVELHRRLINQLSAALYSFHDTFFALSVPEQMLIIAADRLRKREKLKRPQSGRSSARSKASGSSRSDKSLNASRSSSKHKLITESPSLTKV